MDLSLTFKILSSRFDEEEGRVELDYPRDMSMWKGVGYNIDSVFQWKDGKINYIRLSSLLRICFFSRRLYHTISDY